MSSASMKPQNVAAALTVTVQSARPQVTFNPPSGEIASGGVVGFVSGDNQAWEIELWNRDNDDAHPLRLYVPPQGGGESEMVADPASVPRDVKFNVMAYQSGKGGVVGTGGAYTIKITSGVEGER